jgi:hypothetical protein
LAGGGDGGGAAHGGSDVAPHSVAKAMTTKMDAVLIAIPVHRGILRTGTLVLELGAGHSRLQLHA